MRKIGVLCVRVKVHFFSAFPYKYSVLFNQKHPQSCSNSKAMKKKVIIITFESFLNGIFFFFSAQLK